MNDELWAQAEALAKRNYTVQVSLDETTDGEPMYLARNPELFGCKAQGETIEEAIESLAEARADYIYFLLEDELPVPEPQSSATSTTVSTSGLFIQGYATGTQHSAVNQPDHLYEATLKS